MRNRERRYRLINLGVILAAVLLFVYNYQDVSTLFGDTDFFHIFITFITVLLVHLIKAGRLYLALYGTEITLPSHVKIYSKVTPVGVVLPFKLGDFFRMYCYGRQLGNNLKGIVIILLDWLMDSIALVSILLLIWMMNGGHVIPFVYVIVVFLVLVMIAYLIFPGMHGFWKKFILCSKATKRKLVLLRILDSLDMIYREIEGVTKGRGILLYAMSLAAWAVEMGSIAIRYGLSDQSSLSHKISEYLLSAMGQGRSAMLRQFIYISIVLLIAVYMLIKTIELLSAEGKRGKTQYENNRGLR